MESGIVAYRTNIELVIKPIWAIPYSFLKTITYWLVFVLIGLLIAWLFMLDINFRLTANVKKIVYAVLFLIMGIIHFFSLPKFLRHVHDKGPKFVLIHSILLAVLLGLSTFSLFMFKGFNDWQIPVAGACSFLLPAAVLLSWNYFDAISPGEYKPWFLPDALPVPKNRTAVLLNTLQIRMKLKINYFDISEGTFVIMAPGRLKLGQMFQVFLMDWEDEDKKIELADQYQHPFAWRFFLKRPLGITALDPEISLDDNEIRQNDTIVVERIKMTESGTTD